MKQQQLLELYDNYSDNAFRLAMSFLGNIADSEDIVQNVYTKLIEKSPHISRGCEKSYILTMTANMCRNHLKSAANRLNSSYEELANDDLTSGFNMEEQSKTGCPIHTARLCICTTTRGIHSRRSLRCFICQSQQSPCGYPAEGIS